MWQQFKQWINANWPTSKTRSDKLGECARAAKGQGKRTGWLQEWLQGLISKGLDEALERAQQDLVLEELDEESRFIIFSDHHKGARDDADDFQQCEETYLRALDWYMNNGYQLIILGDAEELWENKPREVLDAYPRVFAAEEGFHRDHRYLRLYGNHDNDWKHPGKVRRFLTDYYPKPDLQVRESLLFRFNYGGGSPGEIFLIHGHQGTLDSDAFGSLSRWLVRNVYRVYQIMSGEGHTTPASNTLLRERHDRHMSGWASTKSNLILIAGHTHHPVWTSKTHLELVVDDLVTLAGKMNHGDTGDNFYDPEQGKRISFLSGLDRTEQASKMQEVATTIKRRLEKDVLYPNTGKPRPSYFNTGCCRFCDGDVTGIELADGEIRLVRWPDQPQSPGNRFLERMRLSDLFNQLESS